MSPTKVCIEPRCPEPATYRGRCASHASVHDASVTRQGKAVYGTKRWRMTRRAKLFRDPICEYVDPEEGPCLRPATDVHHRHGVEVDAWTMESLESLCHAHHSRLTRLAQLEGRKGRVETGKSATQ